MKKYDFIESANQVVKNVSKSLRDGNREYTSLSRVLKDIQRSDLLKAGYQEAFAGLGYTVDAKAQISPKQFMEAMCDEQFGVTVTKEGEQEWLGIWGWAHKKDEGGNKLYEADGLTPVMEPKLRKVSAWTPTKIFKCLAQAQAIAAGAK